MRLSGEKQFNLPRGFVSARWHIDFWATPSVVFGTDRLGGPAVLGFAFGPIMVDWFYNAPKDG